MKLIYFVSTRRLTGFIRDHATDDMVPVLNEGLRHHLEHPEDREGDLVHEDLEAAKHMAFDIVADLGDKSIDLLAISIDENVYYQLKSQGDIRTSSRKDAFGADMLWISQKGCKVVNAFSEVLPVTFLVAPANQTGDSPTIN